MLRLGNRSLPRLKNRLSQVSIRKMESDALGDFDTIVSDRAEQARQSREDYYVARSFVPDHIITAGKLPLYSPHDKAVPIQNLTYIPRKTFLSMNPKVVEESTHVHTKVVANAGVNPRHVLNTRVVRKDIIVVGDLKAESNAKFVFLMTPIDHIRESYFSRVFFKETRNLLINSGFVSDQMRDHFYRNLQKLHEETGIDLNKPLTNEDYDLLHESTIYPNGWVFGSLSPYAISAFSRCDELNLHDQEHSFENFRSWEVLKYKGVVETLSVFDSLLERLICEDQAHKAFERTEDDYSIVEYFQYLYNLYHSEAFDWKYFKKKTIFILVN